MTIKKIAAFFLVVMLTIPVGLWANDVDKELTQLITSVKSKIAVPKELTEFRSSMEVQNEASREDAYRFLWEDKAYKIGNVQVVVEKNGNIINYSKYMYNKEYSILAKISYEEGLKSAQNFLNKIASPYSKALKLQESADTGQSNVYEYRFDYYVNNVKVLGEVVSLSVDKQTGEVVNFFGIPTYKGTYSHEKAVITLEKAKENYLNKIGISLVHQIRYDYETRTVKSFPVYEVSNSQNKAIDAKTGEVIIPYTMHGFYLTGKEAPTMEESRDAGSGLTPQEQKIVDEIKGLITKEKAVELGAEYFSKIKEASISSASLYQSFYDNKYIWQINMQSGTSPELKSVSPEKATLMIAAGEISMPADFSHISLSVDAKTGEILSYYTYNNYERKEASLSENQIKAKVETFLKNIAKDKFPLVKYHENDSYSGPIPLDTTSNPYKNYYYRRMVKGVPVQGDGLRVTYDGVNDEITSYTNTWHNTTFKDVTKAVDNKKIIENIDLQLMYINKDNKTRVLAYAHDEGSMAFDPFTGVRVNSYDGKPINSSTKTGYDDIKGHAKEDIIKKLYDSGIYLPGGSFKPDTNINQYDFLRLVLRISNENITEEDLYKRAVDRGIIEEKEKNKNLLITKEQAVQYIINSTHYKEAAKLSDIYIYPFKDEKQVSKALKGYISLAYGFKIIEQNTQVAFNPKAKLTRAQAAEMIYNLLLIEK